MRSFSYDVIVNEKQRAQQQQAERAAQSGVPGVNDLYIKSGGVNTVRFLQPYPFAIDLLVHRVEEQYTTNYVCEKQFSTDPLCFCPICQDIEELTDEEAKKKLKAKRIKNFLVYVYEWEGKTYESNGQQRKLGPLGLLRVTAGDRQGKNWTAIEELGKQWGLTNVDVEVQKVGTGLDTQTFFRATRTVTQKSEDGRISIQGSVFDYNKIMDVLKNVPELPKKEELDPSNRDDVELINKWGDFVIKAGRYRTTDQYRRPQSEYKSNAPHEGTHQSTQTAPITQNQTQSQPPQQPAAEERQQPLSNPTSHIPNQEVPWD